MSGANRLRAVSTDRAGPPEIFDGGRPRRLVPYGDAAAMAKAIDETLAEPGDPMPGIARRARRTQDASERRRIRRHA